jgi:hypothetical protein
MIAVVFVDSVQSLCVVLGGVIICLLCEKRISDGKDLLIKGQLLGGYEISWIMLFKDVQRFRLPLVYILVEVLQTN